MSKPILIRFGQRITLTDGSTPILRDFHDFSDNQRKAFVEHDAPVPWGVDGKTVLGYATRVWVDAPDYTAACDREGIVYGMIYPGNEAAA